MDNQWQPYFDQNKKIWNDRVETHLKSDFYDHAGFMAGKSSLTEIEANALGDVNGKTVLIVDDMISTGGSIAEACRIVKKFGAKKVYVGATHAVLCGPAHERLANSGAERIFLTDTIPCPDPPA